MRHASDTLALSRCFFVQTAAVLLLVVGVTLLLELDGLATPPAADPCAHFSCASVRSERTSPVLEAQAIALIFVPDKSLPEKEGRLLPLSLSVPPGVSFPLLLRPHGTCGTHATMLPSWRGLVVFPLPPPAFI